MALLLSVRGDLELFRNYSGKCDKGKLEQHEFSFTSIKAACNTYERNYRDYKRDDVCNQTLREQ
ncbi:hypothetical protein VSU01S_26050 [Vibrio superstes NBRC 103154]|uniref:Uncharacterized protein n=1 Tax=Vibrio superstes NBRC 103154 TaxID=1219062 RepID=A0A511QSP2_9VIBR|nr:hypothetical protein VSU01S_26050 [Vibrio superstes NBRC 103154]